jgi:hypothetical protein
MAMRRVYDGSVKQDYVQAMRTHYASRLRLPLDVAVVIALSAFGIYELNSGSKALRIAVLVVSVVFSLMLVAVFRYTCLCVSQSA